MPYVQRDKDGRIIALYGAEQKGFAEEHKPEDDKDIRDFVATIPEPFASQLNWPS